MTKQDYITFTLWLTKDVILITPLSSMATLAPLNVYKYKNPALIANVCVGFS